MKKRLISMLLCVCMVLAYFPTAVFAAEEAGLCEHHGAHTTDCGYAAAVDGAACGHVHDTSCGYAEAVTEVLCTCTETDAAGVVMHTEGCGYVAGEAARDCGHVHDADCGYAEPAAEQPCAYICADCAVTEPMGEPVTEPAAEETEAMEEVILQTEEIVQEPVCTCGTDDSAFHATFCALYEVPAEPQCACVEKCAEPNHWCDVCGFDYAACGGTDTATLYEEETPVIGGTSEDGLTWIYDEATGLLTISGNGPMANYKSSNTPWDEYVSKMKTVVIEEGVTSVGNYAFYNGTKITTVTLPEGITSIGERSFYDCGSITNLNLPDSITYIGYLAFYNCEDLADIHFPSSLITIDDDAFQNCDSIVSVDLPEGVTSIGKQAFNNCDSLTSVYLPDNLTFIGGSAFLDCSKLVQIAIPEGITSIENRMFDGCSGLTNVTLPSSLQTIGTQAFNGCTSLAAIDIPDSVTVIGNNAFNDCASLTEIVIPDGVTVLGVGVLRGCTGITDIVLHGGITEIGQYALKESGIETIHYLGDASAWNQIKISTSSGTLADAEIHYCTYEAAVEPTCTETGREDAWVCDQCGVVRGSAEEIPTLEHNFVNGTCSVCGETNALASGTCGENLTWVLDADGTLTISGEGAMLAYTNASQLPWHSLRSHITSVSIGESVTSIGNYAFNKCTGIKEVPVIPASVTVIGDSAFSECRNMSGKLVIPEGVTGIGNRAFYGCYGLIEELVIPDSVRHIGEYAFCLCRGLTSVVIGNISSIGVETFYGCNGVKEITFNSITPPTQMACSFLDVYYLETVWVPTGTLSAYTTALSGKLPEGTVIKEIDICGDNHTEVIDNAVPATCTETGLTEGKHCSACGEVLVAQEVIPAVGHNFINGVCIICNTAVGLVITTQPTDAEAPLNERYCVTVAAEGEGLKYQWYFKNAGTDKWYTSGVRDNTYDDVMTKARAGREIYCVITDAFGNTVTTEPAKLIRVPKAELKILTQPVSDEAAMGEDFCVTVEAQGEDLKYQWYFKNAGTDKWYTSGVRDNTYDDVMTKARAGREIYCVITDALGNQVKTDVATLVLSK